jgi:hypothetical protein
VVLCFRGTIGGGCSSVTEIVGFGNGAGSLGTVAAEGADGKDRSPERGGQKVARGKREARSPWIANNRNSGTEGRQSTTVRVSVAPAGLACFLGMIQGRRARSARTCPWLPSDRPFRGSRDFWG